MSAVADTVLLDTWDLMQGRLPVVQALTLLGALTGEPAAELAAVPIGWRDARLLRLYTGLFGPAVEAVADCSACGELVALDFDLTALQVPPGPAAEPEPEVRTDRYAVRFRLPGSRDLIAVAAHRDGPAARRALLERCVLSAALAGEPVPAEQLPDAVMAAVAARMAEADPYADISFDLSCPACGWCWRAGFDVLALLVDRLAAWSARTLAEVHELARAYGWAERDVLAISIRRRQRYLELVGT